MTVEVDLHEFCGDDCPWFELYETESMYTAQGERLGGYFTCSHYRLCYSVAERIRAAERRKRDAGDNEPC